MPFGFHLAVDTLPSSTSTAETSGGLPPLLDIVSPIRAPVGLQSRWRSPQVSTQMATPPPQLCPPGVHLRLRCVIPPYPARGLYLLFLFVSSQSCPPASFLRSVTRPSLPSARTTRIFRAQGGARTEDFTPTGIVRRAGTSHMQRLILLISVSDRTRRGASRSRGGVMMREPVFSMELRGRAAPVEGSASTLRAQTSGRGLAGETVNFASEVVLTGAHVHETGSL
jgi:hypothetical protein